MTDKGSGWHRESKRHSLAARGIETGKRSSAKKPSYPIQYGKKEPTWVVVDIDTMEMQKIDLKPQEVVKIELEIMREDPFGKNWVQEREDIIMLRRSDFKNLQEKESFDNLLEGIIDEVATSAYEEDHAKEIMTRGVVYATEIDDYGLPNRFKVTEGAMHFVE